MKNYKTVDISETKLEDLVRKAPHLIEDELEFVDHQSFTTRGPLDVLFRDAGKSLVVAELKVTENDSMLDQAIDYYDYVNRNIEGYARAYSKLDIDPSQELRLMLIAPSFSIQLLNRIKWIDIPITLISFQSIQFEGSDDIILIYNEVNAPSLPERIQSYTLDERYNYIKDSESRKLAKWVVEQVKSWDKEKIKPEPLKYSISIKYEGNVLAYIDPRRQNFRLGTYNQDGKWVTTSIESKTDFENFIPIVKEYYKQLKLK
ncbi:endonuclease NucS domain-containing protein [Gracilimonas mengyeensis]|uniref:Endonuclease NucS C-terminal domain-containing protein n=1 Tax=Gracilimonas mengyeensis TaxID=1302730 RepID=A0A521D331_9BACT|nr:endonuclease NucS domain-containing protein [Gracilimonas mengyeensis]SMO66052.1 Protein of unknown function DUF91 [Gracilimonas mengyeensis]